MSKRSRNTYKCSSEWNLAFFRYFLFYQIMPSLLVNSSRIRQWIHHIRSEMLNCVGSYRASSDVFARISHIFNSIWSSQ